MLTSGIVITDILAESPRKCSPALASRGWDAKKGTFYIYGKASRSPLKRALRLVVTRWYTRPEGRA